MSVMKLFGAMMIFNGDCRRHMKKLHKGVLSGKIKPDLDRQEAGSLYEPAAAFDRPDHSSNIGIREEAGDHMISGLFL